MTNNCPSKCKYNDKMNIEKLFDILNNQKDHIKLLNDKIINLEIKYESLCKNNIYKNIECINDNYNFDKTLTYYFIDINTEYQINQEYNFHKFVIENNYDNIIKLDNGNSNGETHTFLLEGNLLNGKVTIITNRNIYNASFLFITVGQTITLVWSNDTGWSSFGGYGCFFIPSLQV
jgi:hypothetical protein